MRDHYGIDCFADDTGLMVDALDGAPGVYTARFAGEHCCPDDNIDLLLEKLRGETNRRAEFRTVVALAATDGSCRTWSGSVEGHSRRPPRKRRLRLRPHLHTPRIRNQLC